MLGGHDGVVLGAHRVRHAEDVPQHHVAPRHDAVGRRPHGQPVGRRVLVWEVAAGEALVGAVRRHPEVAQQEAGAAQEGRLGPRKRRHGRACARLELPRRARADAARRPDAAGAVGGAALHEPVARALRRRAARRAALGREEGVAAAEGVGVSARGGGAVVRVGGGVAPREGCGIGVAVGLGVDLDDAVGRAVDRHVEPRHEEVLVVGPVDAVGAQRGAPRPATQALAAARRRRRARRRAAAELGR